MLTIRNTSLALTLLAATALAGAAHAQTTLTGSLTPNAANGSVGDGTNQGQGVRSSVSLDEYQAFYYSFEPVLVFQLPTLAQVPAGYTFSNANFTFNVTQTGDTANPTTLDAYGLGARTAPDLNGGNSGTAFSRDINDFYFADSTAVDTTDATLLQQNLLTSGAAVGAVSLSNAALTSYLNTQYANGANAGAFVFLRLTPEAFTSNQSFVIGGAGSDSAPSLTYTAIAPAPEPSAYAALLVGALGLGGLSLRARKRQTA